MGLDIVEMVMAVEDEFDVEIPEEEAEKLRTVGDLRDYLVRKAEEAAALAQVRGWCRTQQAFYLLRATARRYRGAHCPRFGPGARLAQVMSPLQWHAARRYLGDRAAGVELPETRRGFLGWPVAHTDEAITFGDLARRIAGARQPVARCRPPLGPEPDPADRDPEVIGGKLRKVVSLELGIPLAKIHYDSRFDEDLHAG